ncbi:hypothetical protein Tco_0465413 [Tanacetum coccineum]
MVKLVPIADSLRPLGGGCNDPQFREQVREEYALVGTVRMVISTSQYPSWLERLIKAKPRCGHAEEQEELSLGSSTSRSSTMSCGYVRLVAYVLRMLLAIRDPLHGQEDYDSLSSRSKGRVRDRYQRHSAE